MSKRFLVMLTGAVALILSVPALAMLFSPEVKWGPGDFIAAAGLLFSTGLLAGFIWRKVKRPRYRILFMGLLLLLLALVWLELAVGLFGSSFAGD